MKNPTLLVFLTVGVLMTTACAPKSDVERIENNLGDYRFIGLAPNVKVRVLKQEVVKPDSEYSRAKLKVTGIIQQEGDFPVKRYWATVFLSVKMGEKEIGTGRIGATVESNTAAFTEDIYLSELSAGVEPRADALKLELSDFGWSPRVDIKEHATLEVSK